MDMHREFFEKFLMEVKELNNTFKCIELSLDNIDDGLKNIASSLSTANTHSVAEEILETRYQIKDAICDLGSGLFQVIRRNNSGFIEELEVTGLARALLENCNIEINTDTNTITLTVDDEHKILLTKYTIEKLQRRFCNYYGKDFNIKVRIQNIME